MYINFWIRGLVLTFFCVFFSSAQTLTIAFQDFVPEIDGASDLFWDEVQFEGIEKINTGIVDSDADLSGRFKVGCNKTHLFFLVQVRDDVLHSDHEVSVWYDDGIEVFIDAHNEKKGTYDDNDFQYQFRLNDLKVYESKHSETTGVAIAQAVSNDTITYEISIPYTTIGITSIKNDQLIGFDLHINDDDGTGFRQGKMAWYSEFDESSENPAYFGTAKFDGFPEEPKSRKPLFSHERGFYEAPFTLTLSSEIAGSTIYYTLDGSNPRFSSTRLSGTAPVDVVINPTSSENRGGVTPGVLVRAVASGAGYSDSKIVTHTYLFLNNVISQTNPGGIWNAPYANFSWPGHDKPQSIDYDMDKDVTGNSKYKNLLDDALMQLPSYSIVTDYDDMFSPASGIFMNALEYGWERPLSLEMINPKDKSNFQVDAGVRIRGRYSRLSRNPKHSFRILFREEYGDSHFKYPLFGDAATDEFKRLDFRTAQNSSWNGSVNEEETVTFLKEIFSRDAQGKMEWNYTKSNYCHLYLNGVYWGMYQIIERGDRYFAETYMGGDKDDYDVIKPQKDVKNPAKDLIIGTSSGSIEPARRLWEKSNAGFERNEAYFDVQGMNADGTLNFSKERLLDIENFIDYLLVAFYMGSRDGPVVVWEALWGQAVRPNNFIAIFNRKKNDGFKWLVHDFEKSMYDENDNWPLIESDSWFKSDFNDFNPIKIHRELLKNDEYKLRMADRIYKHFENGGVFTADTVQNMLNFRRSQIELAVIAESARWGDWNSWRPLQTQDHWKDNVNWLINTYASKRTNIVLGQFKSLGIYPNLKAPQFLTNNKRIYGASVFFAQADDVDVKNPNALGTVYYSTNGKDPRLVGGAVASYAQEASDDLHIAGTSLIKARVKNGDTWSPLAEIRVVLDEPLTDLRITELHYHPKDSDNYEFIELKNTGSGPFNLTGLSFTKGIRYTFGVASLPVDSFVVLAANRAAFIHKYGFEPFGQYDGQLRNSGEELKLQNAAKTSHISFTYNDKEPWPLASDGLGNSLVSKNSSPNGEPNQTTYWRASTYFDGSPNMDDSEPIFAPIIINEILSNTIYPQVDAVELYNPADTAANISGWFLSDNRDLPKKWQVPSGTIIPPKSYLVIRSAHYNGFVLNYSAEEFGNAFSLSSHGEEVYLFSANAAGELQGYSHGVTFGESEFGTSFGRYVNSQDEAYFVAQSQQTFGHINAYPKVGPVVIDEIMYHPSAFNYEYIKLKNISDQDVQLYAIDNPMNTWKIEGIDFEFPIGVTLQAGDSLYVIEKGISAEKLRTAILLDERVQVFNMKGSLDNSGEAISLHKPNPEYTIGEITRFGYVEQEKVRYNDQQPWSLNADGAGAALNKTNDTLFANDPVVWNDGKMLPPTLMADANSVDGVEITFGQNKNWSAGIRAILVNGKELEKEDYLVSNTNIAFLGEVFDQNKKHVVSVLSDNYYAAIVEQSISQFTDQKIVIDDLGIRIYPNPTQNVLFIDGIKKSASLTLSTLSGQVVLRQTISADNSWIEMQSLSSGIYLLNIRQDGMLQMDKVIKR